MFNFNQFKRNPQSNTNPQPTKGLTPMEKLATILNTLNMLINFNAKGENVGKCPTLNKLTTLVNVLVLYSNSTKLIKLALKKLTKEHYILGALFSVLVLALVFMKQAVDGTRDTFDKYRKAKAEGLLQTCKNLKTINFLYGVILGLCAVLTYYTLCAMRKVYRIMKEKSSPKSKLEKLRT